MKPWFHFEKEKQRNECSPLTLERKVIWSLLRRHAGAKNGFDFVSSSRTKFCEAFFDSLKAPLCKGGLFTPAIIKGAAPWVALPRGCVSS